MVSPIEDPAELSAAISDKQIDRIAAEFEMAWENGPPPLIEGFLEPAKENRRAVALELALIDIERRFKTGRPIDVEEYLRLVEHDPAASEQIKAQIEHWREEIAVRSASPAEFGASNPLPSAALETTEPVLSSSLKLKDIQIENYTLTKLIGRGGTSAVYLGLHRELGRYAAVKVLNRTEDDKRAIVRFRREARALAAIQHVNLTAIHDFGSASGRPYIVMEYVAGGTLAERLDCGPMAPRESAQLVATLARAIDVVHQKEIVHRDIKPANIFFTEGGVPKIGDFGLARPIDYDTTRTETGILAGTPRYMAPEQVSGEQVVGPPADIHALGLVLYECLTGRPAFIAASAQATYQLARDYAPPRIRSVNRSLPTDLESICEVCLRKDPSKRYASAAALADDLDRYLAGKPVEAASWRRLRRSASWLRRRKAPVAAGALGILVFVLSPAALRRFEAMENAEALGRESRMETQMRSAHEAWKQGQSTQLREFLDRSANEPTPVALRFVKGYLGTLGEESNRGMIGRTHQVEITALLVDPKNEFFYTAGADGMIRAHKVADPRKLVAEWRGHDKPIDSIGFIKGETGLFVRGSDETIRLWSFDSAAGGAVEREGPPRLLSGRPVAISPALDLVLEGVGAGSHSSVVESDANSGAELMRYGNGEDVPITAFRFGSRGDHYVVISTYEFAIYGRGGNLIVKDHNFGFPKHMDESPLTGTIVVQSSPRVAVIGRSGAVETYLEEPGFHPSAVAISRDGNIAVAGGEEGSLAAWDRLQGWKRLGLVRGHQDRVTAVAILNDDHTVISADAQGNLRAVDIIHEQDHQLQAPATILTGPVAYMPGYRKAMAFDDHGRLCVLDIATGKIEASIEGHLGPVHEFEVSPEGDFAFSSSRDGTTLRWPIDRVRGTVGSPAKFFPREAESIAFLSTHSGNNEGEKTAKYQVVLGCDRIVFADPVSGEIEREWKGFLEPIRDLAPAPSRETLAVADPSGGFRIVDLASGVDIKRVPTRDVPTRLAWSRDGKYFAVGFMTHGLSFFKTDGWKFVADARSTRHAGPGGEVVRLINSSTNDDFLSVHSFTKAMSWYRDTGVVSGAVSGMAWPGRTGDIRPDFKGFVMVNGDGAAYLCSAGLKRGYRRNEGAAPGPFTDLAFANDDTIITVSHDPLADFRHSFPPSPNEPSLDTRVLPETENGSIKRWDADQLSERRFPRSLGIRSAWMSTLTLSPDRRRLAIGGDGGIIEIRDPSSGALVKTFIHSQEDEPRWNFWNASLTWNVGVDPSFKHSIRELAWTADGQRIISLATDGGLRTSRLGRNGVETLIDRSDDSPTCFAVSPSASLIATGHASKIKIGKLVVSEGRCRVHLLSEIKAQSLHRLAFSPDGKSLAVASGVRELMLVGLDHPDHPDRPIDLSGHRDAVAHLAFSPDGSLLASCDNENKVRLWNVSRAHKASSSALECCLTLDVPTISVAQIAFAPDGMTLMCAGATPESGGRLIAFRAKSR